MLSPVDEAGRFYDAYGWLHGITTSDAADQIVGRLAEQGFLLEAGTYLHRYPHCWRCDTPLIWRVTDDWLIAVDDLRQALLDANATVEWTPAYMGKRMDDWLRNMGDWNISRRRYYGLPLPFYPCACGHLNVIGSKVELAERALGGLDQLEELRRPWIDRVQIRCADCGEPAGGERGVLQAPGGPQFLHPALQHADGLPHCAWVPGDRFGWQGHG